MITFELKFLSFLLKPLARASCEDEFPHFIFHGLITSHIDILL